MKWEAMKGQGYKTPADRFFVRNHSVTPHIDPGTWRLQIHGTGVATPIVSAIETSAQPSAKRCSATSATALAGTSPLYGQPNATET